ncbi:BQ2448_2089 [Microbotryum intermedium]|uniref:BQ2448_2089 protein n=1 Tax=Microbotryum intermedium TaxID=269621 RepID=A0A238F8H4_9BASI|nr:BQ2448_2089 [Microbotryum intermedium]
MDSPARPEDTNGDATSVTAGVVPLPVALEPTPAASPMPASADVEPTTAVDDHEPHHDHNHDHNHDHFVDPEHTDASELDNCWVDSSTPQPTSSYIPAGSFDDIAPSPTLDASATTAETAKTTDELDPPSYNTSLTNDEHATPHPLDTSDTRADLISTSASPLPLVAPKDAAPQTVSSREQDRVEPASVTVLEMAPKDDDDKAIIQIDDNTPSSPLLVMHHPTATTPRPERIELEHNHGNVGSSPDPLGLTPVASSAIASQQLTRHRSQCYTSRLGRADSEPLHRSSAAQATPTGELSPATTWPHSFTLDVENRPMKRSTPPCHPSATQDERRRRGNSILAEVPPLSHADDSESEDELGLAPPPRQASSVASRKGKRVARPKRKGKGKGKAAVKPKSISASQPARTLARRRSSFSIEVPFHPSSSLSTPRTRIATAADAPATAPSSTQETEGSLAFDPAPLPSPSASVSHPAHISPADGGSPPVAPSSDLTALPSSRLGTPEGSDSIDVEPTEVDVIDRPQTLAPSKTEGEAASQSKNEARDTIMSPSSPASAPAPTSLKTSTPPPSPPKKRIPRALIERQISLQSLATGSTSKKRLDDSYSSDEDMRPSPTSSTTVTKTKRAPRPKLLQSQAGSTKGQESPLVNVPAKQRRAPPAKKRVRSASSSDDEGKENGQQEDDSSELSELSEYAESPRKLPVTKKRRSDAKPSGSTTSATRRKSITTNSRAGTQSKVASTAGTQPKWAKESSTEDESMQDVESPATTQSTMPSQSQPVSTNPLGFLLAQIAPRETEEQRRSNWNVLRLDNLVWVLVEAVNGAKFWWPADVSDRQEYLPEHLKKALIVKDAASQMTSPSKKPPLSLTLLQDDEQTILQFKPSGEITIDDPQPTNVLTLRTEGKIRFDKTSFCEPSTIEDVKAPSVTAFESVLMKAWELEEKRAEDEAGDEDEGAIDEVKTQSKPSNASQQSKKGRKSVSSSPRKATPKRKKNGKKAASKELEDEPPGRNGSSDDELLRAEDESVGIDFPAIALGFADRAWWGCQVLGYIPAPSQGRQGHRATGKFSVEFIDGKLKNLPRKQIILPIQEEFLTVKLGQSVLNVGKNYEKELRRTVDGFKDQIQAIIDEVFRQAKHWNDEYHAGGNRRVRLAKDALLGELTPEYIEAVLDQIKRWAAGENNVRRKGSDRYEALNETDRSRYTADVLLPLVVQLLTIDELGSRDDGKRALIEDEGIAEPTEAQIEDKAFQLARNHLEKGSIMKTSEWIRATVRSCFLLTKTAALFSFPQSRQSEVWVVDETKHHVV